MIGEVAIVGAINAWLTSRKIDKWARLILSCAASAFCTGSGVFGAGVIAHLTAGQRPSIALTFAFGESALAASAIVLKHWMDSELTKKIPITVPRDVDSAKDQILQNEGMVTYEHK